MMPADEQPECGNVILIAYMLTMVGSFLCSNHWVSFCRIFVEAVAKINYARIIIILKLISNSIIFLGNLEYIGQLLLMARGLKNTMISIYSIC